ncbi:hypothetical protein GDO78_010488 [Eleutherodactylus coqui]|uniref:Uncharacterized protein n=1 Tax=Eleutherodactylus coqui TaxID=57060 RepID=A0A8J6KA82_ELECQ|nr:hypothetical protein GDO78_010488 [Eleutherodactylus coqui]
MTTNLEVIRSFSPVPRTNVKTKLKSMNCLLMAWMGLQNKTKNHLLFGLKLKITKSADYLGIGLPNGVMISQPALLNTSSLTDRMISIWLYKLKYR